ncbi:hypothetical protein IW262DRAFT_1299212 [Armillaria fumosa]|nr:hypothetical protein IW262DRAFT_1299212 [Armillaria fumosa]
MFNNTIIEHRPEPPNEQDESQAKALGRTVQKLTYLCMLLCARKLVAAEEREEKLTAIAKLDTRAYVCGMALQNVNGRDDTARKDEGQGHDSFAAEERVFRMQEAATSCSKSKLGSFVEYITRSRENLMVIEKMIPNSHEVLNLNTAREVPKRIGLSPVLQSIAGDQDLLSAGGLCRLPYSVYGENKKSDTTFVPMQTRTLHATTDIVSGSRNLTEASLES